MNDTWVRCDLCGREFQGQEWMMNTKKQVLCTDCYEDSKEI